MTMTHADDSTPAPRPVSSTFRSGAHTCHAWHFPAASSAFDGPDGRPAVVMAHGFGGTKDSGLAPFARAFAAAGLDVLAFDFRCFGSSEGTPRQRVRVREQVADYRAALTAAAELPGVDPKRLVPWGVSMSGGHVLSVAGEHDVPGTGIAAVISLTPLVHGPAAVVHAMRHGGPASALRGTLTAARGVVSALRGRPALMPLVGRPGAAAALALDGYLESYRALAGPTWRNEVDTGVIAELFRYRPARAAATVTAPLLVQIADFDRAAPPYPAAKAAFAARAEVRHYPCDHFDVWPGREFFATAVEHQVGFLRRHLGPAAETSPGIEAR